MEKQADNNSNISTGDLRDGRELFDWRTRYPRQAWIQIICEATYLLTILIGSNLVIFATWRGWISSKFGLLQTESYTLNKYLYYATAGMLGGVAFGIKFFYRAVARGWWHQDRVIWRLKSPLLAMTLAVVIGALIDASIITTRGNISTATVISIGFLVGYFADEAIGKMYEVANVIFGGTVKKKFEDGK